MSELGAASPKWASLAVSCARSAAAGGFAEVPEALGLAKAQVQQLAARGQIESVGEALAAELVAAAGQSPSSALAASVASIVAAVAQGAAAHVLARCLQAGESAKVAARQANKAFGELEGLAARLAGAQDEAAADAVCNVVAEALDGALGLVERVAGALAGNERSRKVCQFLLQRSRKLLAAAPRAAQELVPTLQWVTWRVHVATAAVGTGCDGVEKNLAQLLVTALGPLAGSLWDAGDGGSSGSNEAYAGLTALVVIEEAFRLEPQLLEGAAVGGVAAACRGLAALWEGRAAEAAAKAPAMPLGLARLSAAVGRLAAAAALQAAQGDAGARAWGALQRWLVASAADAHPAPAAVATRVYAMVLPSSAPDFASAHLRAVHERLRAAAPAWEAWILQAGAGSKCAAAARLEARAAAASLAQMMVFAGPERAQAAASEFIAPLAAEGAPAQDCMAAALLAEEAYAAMVPVVQDPAPIIAALATDARAAAPGADLDAEVRCTARLMALTAVVESGSLGAEQTAAAAVQILSAGGGAPGGDKENHPPSEGVCGNGHAVEQLALLRTPLPRGARPAALRLAAEAAPALTPAAAAELVDALAALVQSPQPDLPVEVVVTAAGAAAQVAHAAGGAAAQRCSESLGAIWKAALTPTKPDWSSTEGAAYAFQDFARSHGLAHHVVAALPEGARALVTSVAHDRMKASQAPAEAAETAVAEVTAEVAQALGPAGRTGSLRGALDAALADVPDMQVMDAPMAPAVGETPPIAASLPGPAAAAPAHAPPAKPAGDYVAALTHLRAAASVLAADPSSSAARAVAAAVRAVEEAAH